MTESPTQIWTGDGLTDTEFSAIIEKLRNLRQFELSQYKDRSVRRRIAIAVVVFPQPDSPTSPTISLW